MLLLQAEMRVAPAWEQAPGILPPWAPEEAAAMMQAT